MRYMYVHTHSEILFRLKKEGNPVICNDMGEPRGHCAKWKKPGTERQILHEFAYMWNPKMLNLEAESVMVVLGAWG